jgi:hypothetical protein
MAIGLSQLPSQYRAVGARADHGGSSDRRGLRVADAAVLLVRGRTDAFTSPAQAQAAFQRAGEPERLVWPRGRGVIAVVAFMPRVGMGHFPRRRG